MYSGALLANFNLARPSLQHPVHILRYRDECIDNGYRERINQPLTSSLTPPELAGLSGTDLAHTTPRIPARHAKSHECHCPERLT
jgi:hypothetical protein